MRILIPKTAAERIGADLTRTAITLETLTIDSEGVIRGPAGAISAEAADPEAIWISLDSLAGGQMVRLAMMAAEKPSVKWVQVAFAGLDAPIFKQIFDRGVKLTNSDAQAVAIAEYVMGQVLAEWYPISAYREAQRKHEWQRIGFTEVAGTGMQGWVAGPTAVGAFEDVGAGFKPAPT